MIVKFAAPLAAALAIAAAGIGLASCDGATERAGERAGQGVKDDVRGVRDFLYDRGITIDTRMPER